MVVQFGLFLVQYVKEKTQSTKCQNFIFDQLHNVQCPGLMYQHPSTTAPSRQRALSKLAAPTDPISDCGTMRSKIFSYFW